MEIWNPGTLPIVRIAKKVGLTPEATPEATPEVERLIRVMDGEKGLIEMTIPGKPTSGNQKYRLTALGKKLKEKLEGQAC